MLHIGPICKWGAVSLHPLRMQVRPRVQTQSMLAGGGESMAAPSCQKGQPWSSGCWPAPDSSASPDRAWPGASKSHLGVEAGPSPAHPAAGAAAPVEDLHALSLIKTFSPAGTSGRKSQWA